MSGNEKGCIGRIGSYPFLRFLYKRKEKKTGGKGTGITVLIL